MAPGRHSTLRTVSRKSFFVVVALATTATLFQIGELVAAEDYQDDQDVLHLCIFDQPNGSSTQAIWNPSADKYGYWTDPSQWLYDGSGSHSSLPSPQEIVPLRETMPKALKPANMITERQPILPTATLQFPKSVLPSSTRSGSQRPSPRAATRKLPTTDTETVSPVAVAW